jgi:hypothetical protein
MERAGCKGINFGVDSLSDEQLKKLGREHTSCDIQNTVGILDKTGVKYIFDLLMGGPGETKETIHSSIEAVRSIGVPLAGISVGVRVYPGTHLAKMVSEGRYPNAIFPENTTNLCEPTFFISPGLGGETFNLVNEIIGDDDRFLLLSIPSEKGSYNCADDESLCQLIESGARGAYWDIISSRI